MPLRTEIITGNGNLRYSIQLKEWARNHQNARLLKTTQSESRTEKGSKSITLTIFYWED